MGQETADAILVGGGVMGCAAAFQLAKDEAHVHLLEQYTIGNHMGSSQGASRLFRLAHESTDYLELARAAQGMWRELEEASGEHLFQQSDALDIGTPAILAKIRHTLQASDIPFKSMERSEIMERFRHFTLPEGTTGLYQADYALLAAGRTVNSLTALARQHGAVLSEGQEVKKIIPTGGGVKIETTQGNYSAGVVVLCAGSWMGPLLRQLGLEIPFIILKEVVTYYKPDEPEKWIPGQFPIYRHHQPEPGARWGVGFPIFEQTGVKMVLDCTGTIVASDDPDRTPEPAVLDRIKKYVNRILPSLGNNIIEIETCRYTMTPDEEFILDRHPYYPQVVIASPCSGHGFKFAPLIGRILADLALGRTTPYKIEQFRLDRPGLKK
jgi:sarcosine oxidase